jgi:hypothetical protein
MEVGLVGVPVSSLSYSTMILLVSANAVVVVMSISPIFFILRKFVDNYNYLFFLTDNIQEKIKTFTKKIVEADNSLY